MTAVNLNFIGLTLVFITHMDIVNRQAKPRPTKQNFDDEDDEGLYSNNCFVFWRIFLFMFSILTLFKRMMKVITQKWQRLDLRDWKLL